jgi:hypothetical protein
MAGFPRPNDLLTSHASHAEQLRRLRTRSPQLSSENFIMDPGEVRAWPPALPVRERIVGVQAFAGSGTVTIDFIVVRWDPPISDPNPVLVHTLTVSSSGQVFSAFGDNMDYGTTISVETGDYYYPEITAGAGAGNVVATFVVAPA